jgi:hypothetical protein
MTDTPTNTILLRGLPQTIEETDVCCYSEMFILIYFAIDLTNENWEKL